MMQIGCRAMRLDRSESVGGVPLIRMREFLRRVRSRDCNEFELPELAEFFCLEQPAQELPAATVRYGLVDHPSARPQLVRRETDSGEPLHALTPEGMRLCNALFLSRFDRAQSRSAGDRAPGPSAEVRPRVEVGRGPSKKSRF